MASIRLKYTKKDGSSVFKICSTKSREGWQKRIMRVASPEQEQIRLNNTPRMGRS